MGKVPPGGAGSGCYFLLAQKVTKDALGVAFDERYAGGSAHRRLTPKPPITGDALLGAGYVHPAGKARSDCLSCHGPLGPTH